MLLSDRRKGYFFAIIATLALANVYIFSKAALEEVHLFQFGFYWFLFAMLWNVLFIKIRKKKIRLSEINRKTVWAILLNAIFEVLGTILFFYSIQLIENPAIVSFILNLGPVFTLILGYFFLKERFNIYEYGGIFLTVIGVLILNYNKSTSFSEIVSPKILIVVVSALLISFAVIIAKKVVNKLEPIILTSSRIILLFIISFLLMIYSGRSFAISQHALINIIIGSIMGPFLAVLSSYYSYKYIEASLSNVIMSTKSILVVIGAWIMFHALINEYQFIGGFFTIIGIIIISFGKRIKKMKIKKIIRFR